MSARRTVFTWSCFCALLLGYSALANAQYSGPRLTSNDDKSTTSSSRKGW